MRKKLMLTYILVTIITLFIIVLFSWNRIHHYLFARVEEKSRVQVELLEKMLIDMPLTNDKQDFVERYGDEINFRVTLIAEDGQVLADNASQVEAMDNHRYRSEVSQALSDGEGDKLRYSKTMAGYYYYYAKQIKFNNQVIVLRVSVPVEQVQAEIWDLLRYIILGAMLGMLLAMVIIYYITTQVTEPIHQLTEHAEQIAHGQKDKKIYLHGDTQIKKLAEAFNYMFLTTRQHLWELEQKNAELQAIVTSITNGLMAIDEDGRILIYNRPFAEIFHLVEKQANSYQHCFFYEAVRHPEIFQMMDQLALENQSLTNEIVLSIGGHDKLIRLSAVPIQSQGQSGRQLGSLLIADDVTTLRQLETMRRDFVANVSHELKTPLTSIKGFVEVLNEGGLDERKQAERFLTIIDIEVERLTTLIEDILSLSNIETMKSEATCRNEELEKISDEVIELLTPKARKKNLIIMKEYQTSLPLFYCNAHRIKQLMVNLVDNAIKYTNQGRVIVRLSYAFRTYKIEVSDTGIGIGKEHLPRLFERFYRVDKGRSRQMGGTGLGLSIVKHIVELYGGKIKVDSQLERGTTVTIYLPEEKG